MTLSENTQGMPYLNDFCVILSLKSILLCSFSCKKIFLIISSFKFVCYYPEKLIRTLSSLFNSLKKRINAIFLCTLISLLCYWVSYQLRTYQNFWKFLNWVLQVKELRNKLKYTLMQEISLENLTRFIQFLKTGKIISKEKLGHSNSHFIYSK